MKCASCGKTATKYSAQGVPVCAGHSNAKIKTPACPKCKVPMSLRESKFGKFWGCTAFPMCDGLIKM
ncbi:topoisomerase DNA-binding C4 zinc finger domain-containing protein [Candidatus Micrarchaeota archaeon]|nr:topoisomerase DNA-binding C4 zinc finger domain-containing protein [Candidatus Micrarchaeota archaeon]MBU1930828.1 topoisomerase DNA-binding C4 zinc finger domain-containing protein [Candidatus Micrarchaeota archaeon]